MQLWNDFRAGGIVKKKTEVTRWNIFILYFNKLSLFTYSVSPRTFIIKMQIQIVITKPEKPLV